MSKTVNGSPLTWKTPLHQALYVSFLLYMAFDVGRLADQFRFLPRRSLRIIGLVLLATFAISILQGLRPHLKTPQFRMLFGLIGIMIWSTPFAYLTGHAFYTTKYMVISIVLIIVIAATCIQTRAHFRRFIEVYVLIFSLVAFRGMQLYVIGGSHLYAGTVAGAFLADENDFALFLCSFFPLALYLYATETRRTRKYFFGGVFLASVATAMGTFSRGGMLTLTGMTIYLFLTKRGLRKRILMLAVVGGILAYVVLPPEYWTRFTKLWSTTEDTTNVRGSEVEFEDGSLQGRWDAWQAAINMAKAKPLTGVGPGNFNARHHVYRPAGARWDREAHSYYFQTLGELGVPGIAWLFGLLIINLRTTRRLRREGLERGDMDSVHLANALEAGVVAFHTGGAFLSVLYYPHIHWLSYMIGSASYFATPAVSTKVAKTATPESPAPVRRYNVVRA